MLGPQKESESTVSCPKSWWNGLFHIRGILAIWCLNGLCSALRKTFDEAGLPAEIEVYAGVAHGWCPPDSAVYNEEQVERAWARMLVLFENVLA